MKKIAALILSAIIIFSLSFSVLAATEGTAVSSLDGLKALEGKSGRYYLSKDITVSKNADFEPIKNFKGVLDGNGKKIINLTVKGQCEDTSTYVGLFDKITGTVKNLTLENVNIEYTYNLEKNGYIYLGAVAGENNGVIRNCRASGKISVTTADGAKVNSVARVGGIVGSTNKQISNLESYVDIDVSAWAVYAGGIVGEYDPTSSESLKECINHGNVTVNGMKSDSFGGGIVGRSKSTVDNCANYGTVFVKSDVNSYSAGIAAKLDSGNVRNCFSSGKISCEAATECFWDAIVTSKVITMGCYYLSGSVAGKTSYDIKTADVLSSDDAAKQSSFTYFDFSGIWKMADGKLTLQKLTAAKPTVPTRPSQDGNSSSQGTTSSSTSNTTSGVTSGSSGTVSSNESTTSEDEYVPPINTNSGATGSDETNSKPTLLNDFTPKKALPLWIFGVIAVAAVVGVCVFLYTYKKKN